MYLNYCRSLRFDEKPDYAHLRRVFRKLFTINQLRFDYIYDWTPILNGKVSSSVPRPISFSERNQIRGSNVQNFHAKTHSTFIDTKKSSSKDIKAEAKFDDEEFNTRKDIKKNSKVFLARGNKISNEAKPKWSGIFNDEDDIIDEIKKISMNK